MQRNPMQRATTQLNSTQKVARCAQTKANIEFALKPKVLFLKNGHFEPKLILNSMARRAKQLQSSNCIAATVQQKLYSSNCIAVTAKQQLQVPRALCASAIFNYAFRGFSNIFQHFQLFQHFSCSIGRLTLHPLRTRADLSVYISLLLCLR